MKKYIVLLMATAFLGTGCKDKYAEGFAAGETQGFAEGKAYYTANDNYGDGFTDGWDQGYGVGETDGYASGYSSGYDNGFDDGEAVGFASGETAGLEDGEIAGYDDGYDVGYDDGYDAALGLSTRSTNPSVKLAAMVNADLIDYSNLQKFDSKAVVASMGLSHADNGTVDMEKLASLNEQHYLNQMAVQLNAKFGLSADRAIQVAKVAHQFNKLSGTRELTEKDADVFAVEVIGKNMKEVEVAVKESMKGNSVLLDEVLATVGTTNGISSENTMEIITTIFN